MWAHMIGVLMILSSILVIPGYAVYIFLVTPGNIRTVSIFRSFCSTLALQNFRSFEIKQNSIILYYVVYLLNVSIGSVEQEIDILMLRRMEFEWNVQPVLIF